MQDGTSTKAELIFDALATCESWFAETPLAIEALAVFDNVQTRAPHH